MKSKLLTICLLFLTTTIFLSGCAPIKSVELLEEFKPESKTIVFLNYSRYENKFRSALSRYGFKVKKYASVNRVTKKMMTRRLVIIKQRQNMALIYLRMYLLIA